MTVAVLAKSLVAPVSGFPELLQIKLVELTIYLLIGNRGILMATFRQSPPKKVNKSASCHHLVHSHVN